MSAGQNDAAMIDLLRWGQHWKILDRESSPFDQRATAGRTPVGHSLFVEDCVAVAADAFHPFKITGSGHNIPAAKLEICTLRFGWRQSIWMEHCCRPLRRR